MDFWKQILSNSYIVSILFYLITWLILIMKPSTNSFTSCKIILTIITSLKGIMFIILYLYTNTSQYSFVVNLFIGGVKVIISYLFEFSVNEQSLKGIFLSFYVYISQIIILWIIFYEISFSYEYSKLFTAKFGKEEATFSKISKGYFLFPLIIPVIIFCSDVGFITLLIIEVIWFISFSI